jgi:hypothetical protein
MALIFTGMTIPGITLARRVAPPQPHAVQTHFAGVKGASEIRLGQGARPIDYDFILSDKSFRKRVDLERLLAKFDAKILEHGTLHELDSDGTTVRRFLNVTFLGCAPIYDPLRDDARTMVSGAVTYHCGVHLSFWQVNATEDYTG